MLVITNQENILNKWLRFIALSRKQVISSHLQHNIMGHCSFLFMVQKSYICLYLDLFIYDAGIIKRF